MKNRTLLILIIVLLLSSEQPLSAQTNHLKKAITVKIDRMELQDALSRIGEAGDFQFSYNSEIIPGDSLVSLIADRQQVQDLLTNLLGSGIRYKVLGNHIILLEDHQGKRAVKAKPDLEYTMKGFIYDASTGDILASASIYEVEGMVVAATDENGFYRLTLPADRDKQVISFSKNGYVDTLIVVTPKEQPELNIYLLPRPGMEMPAEIPGETPIPTRTPTNIDERRMVAVLVPGQTLIAAENIPVIEQRFLQVSLLPWVGSNHRISGLITNRLSINIFAGYSGGVSGVELGGFLNIVRNDVNGIQLAGFGNIVGKRTNGGQLAGFFNVNTGPLTGLQMAGFSNLAMDTIRGVQLAGFSNALHGPMYGPQISGFANFTSKNVEGVQIAGFANVALGTNEGGQIAGFMNFAGNLKGVQVSFINIADTVSAGAPFGFFSFVRKGYHPFELSADELFPVNLTFKTGVHRLYNIFTIGFSNNRFTGGYGFGRRFPFGERVGLSADLTTSYIRTRHDRQSFEGVMVRWNTTLDVHLFKFISLYGGPLVTAYGTGPLSSTTSGEIPNPVSRYLYENQWEGYQLKVWLGGTLGLRFQ